MRKDLVRIEEKQLVIAEEIIGKIKDLENKRKIIDAKEKAFKEQLVSLLENHNINNPLSFESNDKTLKISYTPSTKYYTFDAKTFEKEHTDLYLQYQKESARKGSIRITVREVEE